MIGKLYGRVLIKRVINGTERAIDKQYCSFRKSKGYVDQVFSERYMCEMHLVIGKDVFWVFTDLEKAFYYY